MAAITEQEFKEWLENPVTKQFKARIKRDVEEMKILAMDVSTEDLTNLQGRYKVAMNILNIEYEDIYE